MIICGEKNDPGAVVTGISQAVNCRVAAYLNKRMHSDKIKLRSFLTTLYFAGELGR